MWAKVRTSIFYERIVLHSFDEEDFKENFRINRTTFDLICEELSAFIGRRRGVCREPLSVGKRVAITLAKLGSSGELRNIAHVFGVSRPTVCVVVNQTCRQIVSKLEGELEFPSNPAELLEIAESFLGLGGLPGVCGAIDGSHIPIKAPTTNHRDYYNRKGFYSVVLQAVVDHTKRFRNINFSWPGSVHDARVLYNSDLFEMCESGQLLDQQVELPGTASRVPMYLVGDPAYPLKTWLMKPVSGNLTQEEAVFNKRLSRSRVHVEHAFGQLKGRFRCCLKKNDAALHNLKYQVAASCVLHNLCQRIQDEFLYEWEEPSVEMDISDPVAIPATAASMDARQMRNLLIEWANL
ncbi:hypothetical protein JTE90_003337 [Oedothorax gibbosus]|uniref:DDE Tnp4 domain-containing protein n=1 Tax=Oedothorax gibbosus TaxID=931172 RepID=A0AAV6UHC0_9ARAC|nr:hypothetical protein JTE90_003337 [Oedothorax gibbosus]